MYLVARIHDSYTILHFERAGSARMQMPVHNLEAIGPPPASIISPELLCQLEVARKVKHNEDKRKRDEATAVELQDNHERLKRLWVKLGRIVDGPEKRQCTLKDLKDVVAKLEDALNKEEKSV
ncbi:hypothetical protein BGZ58_001359 [Dissophora ornata]|nr:hypothetical protein BGZ58_001359 [Dissophora ornata]